MRWTVVMGLAAAMVVAVGCKKDQQESNEILIGHVASLTGDTATFGTSAQISDTKIHNFTLYPDLMIRMAEVWKG